MKMKIRISLLLGRGRFEHLRGPRRASAFGHLKKIVEVIKSAAGRDTREQEIFNSCMVLKIMAIVQNDTSLSTEHIIGELMSNSIALKKTYGEILFKWRNGEGSDSFEPLSTALNSKAARKFGIILSQAEQMQPAELVLEIRAFEAAFAGERTTDIARQAERKSVFATAIAAACIFAVLMNFAIVVAFMDTIRMLGIAFG